MEEVVPRGVIPDGTVMKIAASSFFYPLRGFFYSRNGFGVLMYDLLDLFCGNL